MQDQLIKLAFVFLFLLYYYVSIGFMSRFAKGRMDDIVVKVGAIIFSIISGLMWCIITYYIITGLIYFFTTPIF